MLYKKIFLAALFVSSVFLPFPPYAQLFLVRSSSRFRLPVAPGLTVLVFQGNNSPYDHRGKQAWAFDFTVGQTNFVITAAQGGQVISANDSSNIQCSDVNTEKAPERKSLRNCWTYANYVLIADDDGKTAALYMHLLPHSLKVSTGMHINQGDPLGLAGTTGYSSGVHLHFQVENIPQQTQSPGWWWTQSVPVAFNNPEVLAQQQSSDGVPKVDQSFTVSGNPITTGPIPTPTPTLDFTPFVGTWFAHAQTMVIHADGTATYTGRVFTWCTDDPRPPCDTNNGSIVGGLNTQITFTTINGNTASGTITGGTGDRDIQNNILPVGSPISVTLNPDDTLQVSDGSLLCGPTAIQNVVNQGCISNA